MGDLCWWRCFIPIDDTEKFREIAEDQWYWDDVEMSEGGYFMIYEDGEANYGHYKLLEKMTRAGLHFTGEHGPGGSYEAMVFAAWKGELYEALGEELVPRTSFPSDLYRGYNYRIADHAIMMQVRGKEFTPEFLLPVEIAHIGALKKHLDINELLEEIRAIDSDTHFSVWAPLINAVALFPCDSSTVVPSSISVPITYTIEHLIREGMSEAAGLAGAMFGSRMLIEIIQQEERSDATKDAKDPQSSSE